MGQNNRNNYNNYAEKPNNPTYQLPQAPDIERAVLGALMIDKNAFDIVCEILRPEHFYDRRNQMVFKAIWDLSMEKYPVDILTVADKLAKNGTLNDVGGPSYIAELSSRVASSASIKYHANIIIDIASKRHLITLCQRGVDKGLDPTVDTNDVKDEMKAGISEIEDSMPNNVIKKSSDYVGPTIKEIQAAAANMDGISGIPSYGCLDEKTRGWQNSDLIIIAGRPSEGKTALSLNLATIISIYNKVPAAFFSLEMSGTQLIKRIISCTCSVDGKGLLSGQLTTDEWERIDKNLQLIIDAPLFIDDTPNLTVDDFRSKVRRLVKEGVKIIFVDYLQLMHYNGKRFNTRQEEVAAISRALKGVAKEFNIPIIILSQLNRCAENREGLDGKKPRLSDLRESGAIEQDADIVIFVYRPESHGIFQDDKGRSLIGVAKILIQKHRKGPIGEIEMNFKPNYTRFQENEDWEPVYHTPKSDSSTENDQAIISEDGEPLPF